MNYKSQLRGWAVDRVIELSKANESKPDLAAVKTQADDLAAYAYVPREDLDSTAKDLFELVRNAADGQAQIEALIGTLEHIQEDRMRNGLDKPPADVVNIKEAH